MSIPLRSGRRWTRNLATLMGMVFFSLSVYAQPCGDDIVVTGSDYVCEDSLATYQLETTFPGVLGTWTIDPPGGGTIVSANPANVIMIDWNQGPGEFDVIVEMTAYRAGCGGTYNDTLTVNVEDDFGIQMACNDTVQVSLGVDCQALVTPDMVLEGGTSMNDDFIVYVTEANGDTIPNGQLDGSHADMILKVSIYHLCSGNSCWGWLRVEDKLDPQLDCTFYEIECDGDPTPGGPDVGLPFSSIGTSYVLNPDGSYTVSGVDSCSDVTLTYVDNIKHNNCPPLVPHLDTIFRTWTAVDASGNSTSCVDTVAIKIGDIDGVVCPDNWDGFANPLIDCRDAYPVDKNGYPSPDYTGYPTNVGCSNIDYDYVDYKLGICESSYKIIREWLIADWCTGRQVYCNQIIKVVDTLGPQVSCPSNDTFSVRPFECLGDAIAPNPLDYVIPNGECGSIATVEVLVKRGAPDCNPVSAFDETTDGVIKLRNGDYRITDLPLGCSWIVYRYTDACGNMSECRYDVFIKEDKKPVPVCDQHTSVTLSTTGTAKVFAQTFDDGSYDNCEIGYFEVRRMTKGSCPSGVVDDTEFRDYVEFCCEDADNSPIMVVMRVYDKSENYNECMVFVNVVDKNPPTLVCPPHITVSCDYNFSDINVFGYMHDNEADRDDIIINDPGNPNVGPNNNWGIDGFYYDECLANIQYDEQDGRNACGVGTISRKWTVQDANSVRTCTQRISFIQYNPFNGAGIRWPSDRDLNSCPTDVSPDRTGEPSLPSTNECADLLVTYDDQVYNIVPDACFKILRLWTVVDWCNNDPSTNRFTYTQVIKIINTDDPYFVSSCDNRVIDTDGPGCSGYVELIAEVADDCTPEEDLQVSFTIDEFKDNDIDYAQGGTKDASNTYPVGTHEICWTVEDKCGNKEVCCYDFTIRDAKKPTPYCRPGIITVVMPTSGAITIWASDLNDGSFDNCTEAGDLMYSFSTNVRDQNRTYDCSDLPNGIENTFEVTVYVWDEAGNSDYCATTITIQDGIDDVCPDNVGGGTTAMLAGNILTESSETVEEVMVMLDGQMPGLPKYDMTHNDGHFAFPSIPTSNNYRIEASRNDNPMNGVSTLDLVMIQRHLLGISSFNTPYKYIAADINNTESVTAGDISELRKLILGYYNEFPDNKSWRFVPQDFDFIDPNDPWPFVEVMDIDDLSGDMMTNDFVAIKVGDLSGDAKANGLLGSVVRSGAEVSISTDDVGFEEGQLVEVDLVLTEGTYTGLQYALQFDNEKVQLADIQHSSMLTTDANLGLTRLDEGLIALSWNGAQGQAEDFDGAHLNLTFEAIAQGKLSSTLSLNTKTMQPEAYDESMEVSKISFNFLNGKGDVIASSNEFELMQNKPNPFDNSTVIGFNLPRTQEASLRVLDVTGKVVKSVKGMFAKGYNQVTLSKEDLGATGVLYYRLETTDRMATRKMILIE